MSEETRRDNARFFGSLKKVPRRALTIGIATIFESKKIILLASGKQKAKAVALALRGEINPKVPASILRRHKNVKFILDKRAGGKLKQDYNKL